MKSRFWLYSLLVLVLCGASLTGCATSPAAQAQDGPPPADIIADPPPLPTGEPVSPTPTPGAAPETASLAGATILAGDTFDTAADLSTWQVIDTNDTVRAPSSWGVQDGRLQQLRDSEGLQSNYATALVTGDETWSDYTVSAAAYTTGNDEMGLVARASKDGFLAFRVRPNGSALAVELSRYDAATGTFATLATAGGAGFELSRWYQLQLVVQGNTIQGLVDGKQVIEANDATLTKGRAGVFGYAVGDLSFDNFAVQSTAN